MKILLNSLSVVYPISGVGQYTLQLGKALEVLLGDQHIFWFGNNVSGNRYDYSNQKGPNFINRVQHYAKKVLREVPGVKTLAHFWRNGRFRDYVRGIKPSLYHETNYAPFYFGDGPTVITISDLSLIRHPEWHPRDRVKYFEKHCLRRLSDIEAIITISEFSRGEILTLLNIDPAKIHITPLGIDQSFHPGKDQFKGLPDRYILYLGNLEPRKNLPNLIKAYQSLPQPLRKRHPLVIAGAPGWHTHELENALRLLDKGEKPILTGYIPQRFLPDIYRGASLFVYPSLYEGFGLPVLEAMASGVPIITSDSNSLPEVAGDAGLFVDPCNVDQLKEGMMELLEDEKKRKELVNRGIARSKLFTWEHCARQTLSVYETVLNKRS